MSVYSKTSNNPSSDAAYIFLFFFNFPHVKSSTDIPMARGHSYVSKAKGHAKSQEYKANVLAWLQTCNDLELTECLQKIALVKDWKLFASTIARSLHYLLCCC